ncbi:MAG: cell division protein FtsX [Crocinitomicaceae bacterium]
MSKKAEKYSSRGLRTSYISTTVGVSLVLFMISLIMGGQFGFDAIQKQAKESLQADIFFMPDVNDAEKKKIEQELKTWDEFSEVLYISQERAIEELAGSGQDPKEILEILDGEFPIDANITFMPKEEFATVDGMRAIKTRLEKEYTNRILEVSYQESSVEDVNLGFKQFVFLFGLIGLLLILIAVAMINNTIRLALYSKRFSIKTMQLVGGTSGYIRRPFIFQAVGIGMISGIVAMALFTGLIYVLNQLMETIQISFPIEILAIFFAVLILLGILLTVISTWFALNKFLRMKLDDLY